VPAVEPACSPVRCIADGDGWHRTSGDRQEYALPRGDLLVRASARTDAVPYETLRTATTEAHAASPAELDDKPSSLAVRDDVIPRPGRRADQRVVAPSTMRCVTAQRVAAARFGAPILA
jgi:hypothetical protein